MSVVRLIFAVEAIVKQSLQMHIAMIPDQAGALRAIGSCPAGIDGRRTALNHWKMLLPEAGLSW